ncbi:MAG: hypothetical protein BWY76_02334 [bacterium ADurb.Bin429]|nr:MAG: hypothetical protein BWY76_02334 [bacterium ADurb.Bin429]
MVLHLGAALFKLAHRHGDALQQVQRLKAGNDDGHAELLCQRFILIHTHHRADMPGGEEAVHAVARRGEQRSDGRRHEHVGHEQRKVRHPQRFRPRHRQRVGGGGRFKAHREEDHLAIGMLPREGKGIQRRVDDAHVAAVGFHREEVFRRARHAQHVAVGAEDDLRARGDFHRFVNEFHRRHAHRAAGAVHQRDRRRQQRIYAELDDGVRLPPADFHDRPRAGDQPGQRIGVPAGGVGVAVFVHVFHARSSASPSSSRGKGLGERDSNSPISSR